jgi:branched-chain amino acid aminotransferase
VHNIVCFNGEMVAAEDAKMSALSAAALYGRGVFTTIAIHAGHAFLWEKHWRRLDHDAARIGFSIADLTQSEVERSLSRLIELNSVSGGRARITIFDESPTPIWPVKIPQKKTVLITTADVRPISPAIRIEVSSARVSSLAKTTGIKSCNYLDSLLAYEEARGRGFDEAIRLNERGEIVSACLANIFWLAEGRLFTPDIETGCVAGTTREYVLENIECHAIRGLSHAIHNAEAIFLTSAGLGVAQVAAVAGRELPPADHPILHLLGNRA